jgi:predicted transcriptional regulator
MITSERQRIFNSIENRKRKGILTFSYDEIAKEAEAYHTNVAKLVKSLEKKGIVRRRGGKGVLGNPYLFEIIR